MPVVINSSAQIKGKLKFATDVHIDCEVSGTVESDKKIIIGPNGFFKGELCSEELLVLGKLEGDICVKKNTTLHSGSSLSGTLNSTIIELKIGAILNAQIIMNEPVDDIINVHRSSKGLLTENLPSHDTTQKISEEFFLAKAKDPQAFTEKKQKEPEEIRKAPVTDHLAFTEPLNDRSGPDNKSTFFMKEFGRLNNEMDHKNKT